MNRRDVDEFTAPVSNHSLFFCGFHCAKKNPKFQVTTMHYCGMRGDGDYEMHQCLLYDSVSPEAKLIGVEYIVSDKVFRSLPSEERKYWHPHTYEVLGGGLVAPSMSDHAEMDFMTYLLTTWGKTWQTWPDPATPVPMGEPLLMWSLTGDGQVNKKLVAERDKQFAVSTAEVQAQRVKALGYEVPQVPPPTSVAAIGRQWTASGEDGPTPRKKSSLRGQAGVSRFRNPVGGPYLHCWRWTDAQLFDHAGRQR
jgi:hypothetical protein